MALQHRACSSHRRHGRSRRAARVVQNLQSYIASTPSDFPQPQLTIDGIENWLDDGPALLMEDKLREELAKARRFDGATGITSLGPHRSDLQASHPEKNMPAALCSTGEQKSPPREPRFGPCRAYSQGARPCACAATRRDCRTPR